MDASDPTPRRVLIVVNPISGGGRGVRAAEELARGFRARGVAVECELTRARGDAARILAAAAPADLVVAVGGDGTFGEVLQGLPDVRTRVGLLPRGTANGLARALRLPHRVPEARKTFLGGRTLELDVARVGARLAHLVVGVGLDARALAEVEARHAGPRTRVHYLAAGLRALRRHRSIPLTVTIDGGRVPGTSDLVWVSNASRYAGILRLDPAARVDDGAFEVYLFPSARFLALAAAFARALVTHIHGGAIVLRRARTVRIEADEPVPCQVDGELGGNTPVLLEVLPARHRLVVPAP